MKYICLCGIEHERFSADVSLECRQCGQRWDFAAPQVGILQIGNPDGTFTTVAEVTGPLQVHKGRSELDDLLETVRAASKAAGIDIVLGPPMSISEFMAMLEDVYLYDRRN